MRRRALLQLGLIATVVVGVSGGAMAADISVTTDGNSSSTGSSSSSGGSTVVVDQHTTTTVGSGQSTGVTQSSVGSTDSADPAASNGGATNTSSVPSVTDNSTASTDSNDVKNTTKPLDSSTIELVSLPAAMPVGTGTGVFADHSGASKEPSATRWWYRSNGSGLIASSDGVFGLSNPVYARVPVAQPVPRPNQPSVPFESTGFLGSLQYLASIIVPSGSVTAVPVLPAGITAISTLLALLVLSAVTIVTPVNLHTARLRRSGFLGAARSHVLVYVSFFATPLRNELYCAVVAP